LKGQVENNISKNIEANFEEYFQEANIFRKHIFS